MRVIGRGLAAVALAVAATAASGATILYDSGVTIASINGGAASDLALAPSLTAAQRASFATDVSLQSAQWTGLYGSNRVPVSDVFVLNVYADAGGAPAAAPTTSVGLAPTRVDSGSDLFGSSIFEYDSAFAPLSLTAGSYWFSVINDTTGLPAIGGGGGPTIAWNWTSQLPGPSGDGLIVGQPGSPVDFDLTLQGEEIAPVPLPAGLPALAAALLLLGVWRRLTRGAAV